MAASSPHTPARPSKSSPAPFASEDRNRNVAAPKGVTVLPKAVVPKETELKGQIEIGAGTVVHPSAKILAENGPIVIGAGNLIEEKVVIRNNFPPGENGESRTLFIGSRNHIETYAVVEGSIGNSNTISMKAYIGPASSLSSGCVIGPRCSVTSDETLPPNTIIFADGKMRRTLPCDQQPPYIDEHAEFLQRQLPNYHFVLKSTSTAHI